MGSLLGDVLGGAGHSDSPGRKEGDFMVFTKEQNDPDSYHNSTQIEIFIVGCHHLQTCLK